MPVDGFKQIAETFQCSKDFMEKCNQNSVEKYFIQVDVQYIEKLRDLDND